MADYRAELARQTAPDAVARRVRRAREILGKIGPWIDRYRGGMPAGFAAAIVQWESDGNFAASGDAELGEIGYFQVAKSTPGLFGLPAASRTDPEVNVFLGLLEYQVEAIRMHLANPLVVLGSADSWKLARLAFAIGSYGARTLITEARPTIPGRVFDAVRAYVDRAGGRAFGSQSAEKVWYRVHTVDLVWRIGNEARTAWPSAPETPPTPKGMAFSIPAQYRPFFGKGASGTLLLVALAAVSLALVVRRYA